MCYIRLTFFQKFEFEKVMEISKTVKDTGLDKIDSDEIKSFETPHEKLSKNFCELDSCRKPKNFFRDQEYLVTSNNAYKTFENTTKCNNNDNNISQNFKIDAKIFDKIVDGNEKTYTHHLHKDPVSSYHNHHHHHRHEDSSQKKNKHFSKPFPVKNRRFSNKNHKNSNNLNYKNNKRPPNDINNKSLNNSINEKKEGNTSQNNRRRKCRRKRKAGEHHRRNSWVDEPSSKKNKEADAQKLLHLPRAPYNSNQFLMEDHGPQNTPSPFHTPPVKIRTRVRKISTNDDNDDNADGSYLDSEDNFLNSDEEEEDDDEDENFISEDFQKDYDQLRADMLAAMPKEDLIRECLKLETMLENCQKENGKLMKMLANNKNDSDTSRDVSRVASFHEIGLVDEGELGSMEVLNNQADFADKENVDMMEHKIEEFENIPIIDQKEIILQELPPEGNEVEIQKEAFLETESEAKIPSCSDDFKTPVNMECFNDSSIDNGYIQSGDIRASEGIEAFTADT